ncbi:MAG: CAP domain-containing protein [Eubacteriales bacterium]|nr:CAP domain-containing protein [Eubacteriales bacterium]
MLKIDKINLLSVSLLLCIMLFSLDMGSGILSTYDDFNNINDLTNDNKSMIITDQTTSKGAQQSRIHNESILNDFAATESSQLAKSVNQNSILNKSLSVQSNPIEPSIDSSEQVLSRSASVPEESLEPVVTEKNEPTSETCPIEVFDVSLKSDMARQIFNLINAYRTDNGLKEFSNNNLLEVASGIRANELSTVASHQRPNGTPFYTVFDDVGLSVQSAAENFAIATADVYTAEQIVNGWLGSPVHKVNIMNDEFTQMGIGFIQNNGQDYFVQLFTTE